MIAQVGPVGLAQIEAARARLAGLALATPLVRCDAAPAGKEICLKLENLQPVGSFKVRPIANVVLARPHATLADGIYTTSTGNSALGVAWMARRLGLTATAVVPENAPEAKLGQLRRLGARIDMRSFAEWWRAIESGTLAEQRGVYIDAVRDAAALAGDATIALEVLEQNANVEAILVPFGGGGLACGIGCAVRALRSRVRVIACELASAHPLTACFAAGTPVSVPHQPGFVSGVGFGSVLPEMWPLIRSVIDEVITVSLGEVSGAIELLARHNRVIAEGAGAVSVAAALSGRYRQARVCAVVSGGNIDSALLATILRGGVPA
jgi:threonine dehydratase